MIGVLIRKGLQFGFPAYSSELAFTLYLRFHSKKIFFLKTLKNKILNKRHLFGYSKNKTYKFKIVLVK
jgi:hypothetical protein